MNTISDTSIIAKSMTFSRLFHTGRFTVPWHQRLYDWTPEHVNELIVDINEAIEADRRCYFLGSIMLVQQDQGLWRVNDGQQRMVTFSLISACLCRLFHDYNDSRREALALRILFDLEETSTDTLADVDRAVPRITPPRDDRMRYHLMIRNRKVGGNGKMTVAWHEIDQFVAGMGLERSQRFFNFLIQRVEVACLYIPPFVDPNSVFETLNCRGKRLDDLDLLRNHLYSYFNADDNDARRDIVHNNLEGIRDQLREERQFQNYARCYFQARYGFLPKKNFYREVKQCIHAREPREKDGPYASDYVYRLIDSFSSRDYVELYRQLARPKIGDPSTTAFARSSGHSISDRNLAIFLHELHAYTVTQPLVFALLSHYVRASESHNKKQLAKWTHVRLKHLTSFIVRTALVLPKFEPSDFENAFSDLAASVMSAPEPRKIEFDKRLKECDIHGVINDSRFVARMNTVALADNKRLKRLLIGVNRHLQPDGNIINENHCTVEHILPKSRVHWKHWTDFDEVEIEDYVDRIGNLTILSRQDNKAGIADNRDFAAKKDRFARSAIKLTKDLRRYARWSPREVNKRQKTIAGIAAEVWSFEPTMATQ